MSCEEAQAYLMRFGTYGGMLIANLTMGMRVRDVKAEITRLNPLRDWSGETYTPEAACKALKSALPFTGPAHNRSKNI